MPENRAYKLNKQKQPAPAEGKFLHYFYNHGKLTSAEVTEEQFYKLVSFDTAFYNNDRRAHDHKRHLRRRNRPAFRRRGGKYLQTATDSCTIAKSRTGYMKRDTTARESISKYRPKTLKFSNRSLSRH